MNFFNFFNSQTVLFETLKIQTIKVIIKPKHKNETEAIKIVDDYGAQ